MGAIDRSEPRAMFSGVEQHARDARLRLLGGAEVQRQAAETLAEPIAAAADMIAEAYARDGKTLLCGNGGSAADCQHMAAELVGHLRRDSERVPLPALSLATDTSFLTGFANDRGFDHVFERQVQAFGRPGDVLVAISTSGNSPNVILAVAAARRLKISTIGLTGRRGRLATMVDVAIAVPSDDTQYIQEAHLAVEHVICDLVEQRVIAASDGKTGGTFK
jgi:D-sedoheptulose 7-phosphate isomerase